jgi:hypothetical protein
MLNPYIISEKINCFSSIKNFELGVVVYVCNPSTRERWRQKDHKFKARLGYLVRPFDKSLC